MGIVKGSNSLFFASGLDNSGLQRGSNEAMGIIQSLGSKISKINPFAILTTVALAAFMQISASAYGMVKDFEHAMKEVETISAATQKDFKGIASGVFDLSKITPDNPEKLAKAYYQIVSAGYDGAEGLGLLEVAANAAVAGVTDTITAADGLTTVLNAFNYDVSESTKVADIMFKTVQLGKTTFPELAQNFSQVAPLASAMGISFEEVSGAIATLTKQGTTTPMAITQIRSAIIGMSEALGDGWSKTMTFQEGLNAIVEKAGGSDTKLKEMMGRIEGVSAALSMTGSKAKGAADDLEAMYNATGSQADATERMLSSTTNQWALLGNKIKAQTKGLGEFFLEASNGLAKYLNMALEETENVTDKVHKQASEYQLLKRALESSNTPFDKKLEILKDLKETYPDYLKSLDLDKIKNDNLEESLQKVKTVMEEIEGMHNDKIYLSTYIQDVEDAEKTRDEYQKLYEDNLNSFRRYAIEAASIMDENNIEYTFSAKFDDPEKIYDELQKTLFEEKRDSQTLQVKFTHFDAIKESEINSWDISKDLLDIRKYNKLLDESNSLVQTKTSSLNEQRIKLNDNANGYKQLSSEIKKTYSVEALDENFGMFKHPDFIKGVEEQKKAIAAIAKIRKITLAGSKKGELKQYLESENEVIRKAAEDRKKILLKNSGGTNDSDFDEYKKDLNSKKDAYKLYEAQKTDVSKKAIVDRYELELETYANFGELIAAEMKEHEKNAEKLKAIYDVIGGDAYGQISNRSSAEVIPIKIAPINLDNIQVQTPDPSIYTSIEEIQNKITELNKKALKARTKEERKALGESIKFHEKKLKAAKEEVDGKEKAEESFYKVIQSLSRKGLIEKKKKLKEELAVYKKNLKEKEKEYKETQEKIAKIDEEIGEGLAGVADKFSSAFSEMSELFSKFGDEDMAQLFSQLAGVADGVSDIANGNWIQGGFKVLNSMLTVEVVSDTAKFEEVIKELEKAVEKLDYAISKSFGREEISSRKSAIKDLEELQIQAEKARQAELEAQKEVKLLGITIAKKGEGSGTDSAKLEELEQQAEEAKRKVQELKDELNELFTGATKTTLADGILEGLSQGKKGIADFAETFEQMMKNAMLQSFKTKYLYDASESFFGLFASLSESNGGLDSGEMNYLRDYYNDIVNGAQEELEALNEILGAAGISGIFDDVNQQQDPLQGAINRMTEETGSEFTGLTRRQLDEIKSHTIILQESNNLLSVISDKSVEIAHNTLRTADQLVIAVTKLEAIEKNTSQSTSPYNSGY